MKSKKLSKIIISLTIGTIILTGCSEQKSQPLSPISPFHKKKTHFQSRRSYSDTQFEIKNKNKRKTIIQNTNKKSQGIKLSGHGNLIGGGLAEGKSGSGNGTNLSSGKPSSAERKKTQNKTSNGGYKPQKSQQTGKTGQLANQGKFDHSQHQKKKEITSPHKQHKMNKTKIRNKKSLHNISPNSRNKANVRKTKSAAKNKFQQRHAKKRSMGAHKNKLKIQDIPSIPTPPATLELPKGVLAPKTDMSKISVSVMGRWKQIKGSNDADFYPGRYNENLLIFRADNILEVKRSFGKNKSLLLIWRISYRWNKDKKILLLGSDPKVKPPTGTLKGFSLGDIVVTGAKLAIPIKIHYRYLDNKTIQIGTKIYRKMLNNHKKQEK